MKKAPQAFYLNSAMEGILRRAGQQLLENPGIAQELYREAELRKGIALLSDLLDLPAAEAKPFAQ